MAALKRRLTRLEDLIEYLPTGSCPACSGFGHPRRFVIPWIGNGSGDFRFGDQVVVPDDRVDGDGRCVVCGALSMVAPVVELGAPPELERKLHRLVN